MATRPQIDRAWRAIRCFVRGMIEHNAFEAAAAIAFWFFLSLVPLLVLLGFLIGHVARTKGVDALAEPLLEVVPDTADDIIRKELARLAGGGGTSLAPLGVAGYFWTASSGLHNLMDVFETGLRCRRRAWWKKRLIALGWVILGLLTACLLAWSLVRVDSVLQSPDPDVESAELAGAAAGSVVATTVLGTPRLGDRGKGASRANHAHPGLKHRVRTAFDTAKEEVVAGVLLLALGLAFLAGFYRFAVEHSATAQRRAWPGAVTAIACWLLVSWGFGAYVGSIANYALYYGSLAAVAVLLVWSYI